MDRQKTNFNNMNLNPIYKNLQEIPPISLRNIGQLIY